MAETMKDKLVEETVFEGQANDSNAEDSTSDEPKSASHSRKSSSCESTGFVKIDGDEITPVTQSEMYENFDITAEKKEIDALDLPMKDSQYQFYTTRDTYRALSNLIMFSSAMFVLPLLIMFSMYHYVFIDYFNLPPADAMLYAAFCGIAVVFVIVGLFIYVAYNEEKEAEKRLKGKKGEADRITDDESDMPDEEEAKKDK